MFKTLPLWMLLSSLVYLRVFVRNSIDPGGKEFILFKYMVKTSYYICKGRIRTSNSPLIHLKSEFIATKLLEEKRVDTFFLAYALFARDNPISKKNPISIEIFHLIIL
jgi:hypothetical protein